MSCNTKTSLAAVIDAVNAQLNNNYVDRDDPRIDQGVFTEPTIRGGLMLDEAAKLDFCGYVTECGQREPFGKQWVDRPLYPYNTLVSYEDGGEIKSRWQDIDDVVAGTEIGESYTTYEETRSLGLQGYTIIDSFELGATITQRDQALRHAATGKLYRWAEDLPKIVPAGSTPVSSGGVDTNAWLEVSDTALRQEILTGGLITDTFVTMTAKANGGVARNLRNINSARFSVKDYGAVGDGITNDGDAIRKTIVAASLAGGGEVFFEPSATGYATDIGSIDNIYNVTINGNKQTIKNLDPLTHGGKGGGRSPFYIKTGGNITVHSCIFDGGYEKWVNSGVRVNNHNLAMRNVNNVYIYNNTFKDCGYPNGATDEAGDSVYLTGNCSDIYIENNIFINPSRWSIVADYQTEDVSNWVVKDNIQYVTRASNILGFIDLELELASNAVPVIMRDVTIENNTAYFGCMVALSNGSFDNLKVENNTFIGHTFPNATPEDIVYKQDGVHPYGFGIMTSYRVGRPAWNNVSIINNYFENVCKQNIHIQVEVNNLSILDNTITSKPNTPTTSTYGSGIQVTKPSSNVTVTGNIIDNRFSQLRNPMTYSVAVKDGVALLDNNKITHNSAGSGFSVIIGGPAYTQLSNNILGCIGNGNILYVTASPDVLGYVCRIEDNRLIANSGNRVVLRGDVNTFKGNDGYSIGEGKDKISINTYQKIRRKTYSLGASITIEANSSYKETVNFGYPIGYEDVMVAELITASSGITVRAIKNASQSASVSLTNLTSAPITLTDAQVNILTVFAE